MRLIDADALINRMYHDAFETDTDMQKWDSGCWVRYKLVKTAIDEQPTIEPKQGEWIGDKCSVCGEERAWYGLQPNFCPDCGAKMKGTDDGNK